jgi:hypothetical protein
MRSTAAGPARTPRCSPCTSPGPGHVR